MVLHWLWSFYSCSDELRLLLENWAFRKFCVITIIQFLLLTLNGLSVPKWDFHIKWLDLPQKWACFSIFFPPYVAIRMYYHLQNFIIKCSWSAHEAFIDTSWSAHISRYIILTIWSLQNHIELAIFYQSIVYIISIVSYLLTATFSPAKSCRPSITMRTIPAFLLSVLKLRFFHTVDVGQPIGHLTHKPDQSNVGEN